MVITQYAEQAREQAGIRFRHVKADGEFVWRSDLFRESPRDPFSPISFSLRRGRRAKSVSYTRMCWLKEIVLRRFVHPR